MYQNAPSISYLTFPKLNSIALFSFYYISFEILMSSQQIQPNGIRVDSESSFAKLVSSTFSGPVIAIDLDDVLSQTNEAISQCKNHNPPVIWRELWLDLNAKGTMRTTQVPKCIQAISTVSAVLHMGWLSYSASALFIRLLLLESE